MVVVVPTTPVALQSIPERIVAIGDVHGAGDTLATLLRHVELIDDERRWTGGATTFIQTGDFTDRGPQVREVMDLLMQVEDNSHEAGGQVRVLLGNHETMNLTANIRDATPAIFASFASAESEQRREDAYRSYEEHMTRRRQDLGRPLPGLQSRDDWMRAHPVGFLEYMEAMGPAGRYGHWLRKKPIVTVVNDTVFLHGGLAPGLAAESIQALNDTAREEIARFDRYRRHLIEQDIILPFSTLQEIFVACVPRAERLDRPALPRSARTRPTSAVADTGRTSSSRRSGRPPDDR